MLLLLLGLTVLLLAPTAGGATAADPFREHVSFCYGKENSPESLFQQGQALMQHVLMSESNQKAGPPLAGALPILLVCGHSGPCEDVLWQLTSNTSLSLPREDIVIYGHYMARGMSAPRFANNSVSAGAASLPLGIAEYPVCTRLSRASLAADAALQQTYASLAREFSTIICTFPGNQCAGFFRYQPKMLVLHFSHRWHHHLDATQSAEFREWMIEAYPDSASLAVAAGASAGADGVSKTKLTLVANNPFDVHHMYQYLGVVPLCLPSLYGNMLRYSYAPQDAPSAGGKASKQREVLLLPHHGSGGAFVQPATTSTRIANIRLPSTLAPTLAPSPRNRPAVRKRPSSAIIVEALRSRLPFSYVLKYTKEYLKRRFEYAELGRWKVALVLPYATHTSAINEALSVGVPLLLPSPPLLAALHKQHFLLTHVYLPPASPIALAPVHRQHCDIFTNTSSVCLVSWLRLADFYRFPSCTTFASMDAMPAILDGLFRNATRRWAASERQRAWVGEMLAVNTIIAKTGLTGAF